MDNTQDVEGEYLTHLLANTDMSLKDVYGSITELILAGVDTVNVTLRVSGTCGRKYKLERIKW